MESKQQKIEQIFGAFKTDLDKNSISFSDGTSFFDKKERQAKKILIDLEDLKLYNPPTADLIMFKYFGKLSYRFFTDEEILSEENVFIKDYFGSVPKDFSEYVLVSAFVGLDVNIAKKIEFQNYIDQFSKKTDGYKVAMKNFCFVYKYVKVDELFGDDFFENDFYQSLFIQPLLQIKSFFDYAIKNEFIVSKHECLYYFEEYGLESFINTVSGNHYSQTVHADENMLELRFIYKENGKTLGVRFFITTETVTVKNYSDRMTPFCAQFDLEKNVVEKIREFVMQETSK